MRAKGASSSASAFLDTRLILVFRVLNTLLQIVCLIGIVVQQFTGLHLGIVIILAIGYAAGPNQYR